MEVLVQLQGQASARLNQSYARQTAQSRHIKVRKSQVSWDVLVGGKFRAASYVNIWGKQKLVVCCVESTVQERASQSKAHLYE